MHLDPCKQWWVFCYDWWDRAGLVRWDVCAQAVQQLFTPSSRIAETGKECVKARERGRSNRKRREGRSRTKRKSQVYLPLALQADQVSVAPCWVVLQNLARLLSNRFSSSFSPSPRMATINTLSAQCIENMLKMTTPPATAHGKERERERERNKGENKREREPERHTGELVL